MKALASMLMPAALLVACTPPADPASMEPAELVSVIAKAAKDKDFETLSEHMVDDFHYSFGRGPSRSDALARYRAHPEMLDQMASVLGRECASNTSGSETYFVCPAAALDEEQTYYGWRAGFQQRDDGSWAFIWFVAGD